MTTLTDVPSYIRLEELMYLYPTIRMHVLGRSSASSAACLPACHELVPFTSSCSVSRNSFTLSSPLTPAFSPIRLPLRKNVRLYECQQTSKRTNRPIGRLVGRRAGRHANIHTCISSLVCSYPRGPRAIGILVQSSLP